MERRFPIKVRRMALAADSGGAGRFRGGLGIVREYETLTDTGDLSLWFERSRTPGLGLFGGRDGAPPRVVLNPGRPDEEMLMKVNHRPLPRGTVVRAITGGGGGYGDPGTRDREAVRADLRAGYISAETAASAYGLPAEEIAAARADEREWAHDA
jgi:N-methylhydantoinase B